MKGDVRDWPFSRVIRNGVNSIQSPAGIQSSGWNYYPRRGRFQQLVMTRTRRAHTLVSVLPTRGVVDASHLPRLSFSFGLYLRDGSGEPSQDLEVTLWRRRS